MTPQQILMKVRDRLVGHKVTAVINADGYLPILRFDNGATLILTEDQAKEFASA